MTAIEASTDRAMGTILGSACGDALGAGHGFGASMAPEAAVEMAGGGPFGFAPGEWTDDTSMAIPILETLHAGLDLTSPEGLDSIADGWFAWLASGPRDIGSQTSMVMNSAATHDARGLRQASRRFAAIDPHSAGSGSLIRTAPVALADAGTEAITTAATVVSELTHDDASASEACVIWSLAIAHAIRHGNFDGVHLALESLPPGPAAYWRERLQEAETRPPSSFKRNGWVVEALQAAWALVVQTPVPRDNPSTHLAVTLENAVRAGHNTNTVACIAGALLGARWGATAIPPQWLASLHGWPGYRAEDLVQLVAGEDAAAR